MSENKSGAQVAEPSEVKSALGVGSILAAGRYRLVELLGSGGFGQVFRAEETGDAIRRDVAIKVLHPHIANQGKSLERFRTEVRLIGALNDPNIIQVFWDGTFEGRLFFVMEYRAGSRSLAQVVQDARSAGKHLALAVAKDYFVQVAYGLRAIHRIPGVFHRDIKLENLLLWDDHSRPRIKIVDFGVAHNPEALLTHTGEGPGTPAYLAPETVSADSEGKPYVLDSRVDLFALGVAMFQFITLELPFQGMHASTSQVSAPLLSSVRPVPEALDAVVKRLLEKNRENRYADADALIVDLQAFDPASACVESPSASSDGSGLVLPSLGDVSRVRLSTDGEVFAHPPIMLTGFSRPMAAPQEAVLDTAGEQFAQALHSPPMPRQRKFGLQVTKRDRAILCGVSLCLALGAGFALKRWRTGPTPLPSIAATDLQPNKTERAAVRAQDILRDERSSENQFVERAREAPTSPPPATRAAQDQPPRRRQLARRPDLRQEPAAARASNVVTALAQEAAPAPVPLSGLAQFQTILVDESTLAEPRPSLESKTLGVPTATLSSATLMSAVSSDHPNTLAMASLINGVRVGGSLLIPVGSQLVGRARYQERGAQWFVELRFDRLVLPDGSERYVQVVATQHGQAGLRGVATKRDSRDESNLGAAVVHGVRQALSDQPGKELAKPFLQDRADDMRELRRGGVVVQLPRGTTFQAQFLKAA